MIGVIRVCFCIIFLVTFVNSIVHHKYVFDRFNDFSENDYKIVFPDEFEEQKSTLLLVNVVRTSYITNLNYKIFKKACFKNVQNYLCSVCQQISKYNSYHLKNWKICSFFDMEIELLTAKPNFIQKIHI